MNKQELIEKFEQFSGHGSRCYIERNEILNLVKQLDEPEKVKVPQFVADWIEEKRDMGWKLTKMVLQANLNEQYWRWVVDNQEKFARAWLDGYEVEKEKRYLVKMKGIVNALSFLSYHKNADIWTVTNKNNSDGHRAHHTRKELEEADFGWVFDCPGIEIEEVDLCH